ncbi:MAG: LysM peptidoglycan-binding domain-containing protein [Chloroflexota bacterium]|nr:LysM peptidoglycan-binding domain-containing protein [Chloroflexota bacterium]
MSLQEAASSGSFNPHVAKPSDAQRTDTPYDPPIADGDVDRVSTDPASPFANPYDYTVSDDDVMGDTGDPDMRASRRRAWTIVGLAIIIPAAVAGVIAWQLFGGNDAPVPTVTRVTTTPAEPVTQEVQVVAAEPVKSTVATTVEPAAESAAVASTSSATASTASAAAASDGAATQTAAAAGEAEVDAASLTPAARLAAWTQIETIQVLPGETLWLIAQNYGTTISAIATLNGITDPELLSVGQELKIPVGFAEEVVEVPAVAANTGETVAENAGSTAITAAATDSPPLTDELSNWHTIAPVSIDEGDSLAAIAEANGTTVEAIMALNGIADPNLIFIGDTLLVPVGYQGETPSVSLTTQQAAVETNTEAADSAAVGENEDLLEGEGTGSAGDEEDQLETE